MKSKQSMKNVKAGGNLLQKSNVLTQQTMDHVDAARNLQQLLEVTEKIDPAQLKAELTKLHKELMEYDPKAIAELQRVKDAEKAADQGNPKEAASTLIGTARWVGEFAQKIGASVVAKIIEKQIGF